MRQFGDNGNKIIAVIITIMIVVIGVFELLGKSLFVGGVDRQKMAWYCSL